MIYLAALLVVVGFAAALQKLGVFTVASKALETSRDTARQMQDSSLTDVDKERATQQAAVALLTGFVSILFRAGIAIAISLLPLLIFDTTGLAHWSDVTHLLATAQGILLASGAMFLLYLVRNKI